MKALIISDDSNTISKLDSFFVKEGFNTIIYKWLLKALDNIEEIKPDLVIVSTAEYPRHWKTLIQFLKSGIGGKKVATFLYVPVSLSDEEQNKANSLEINGIIKSLDDVNLVELKDKINLFFEKKSSNMSSLNNIKENQLIEKKDNTLNNETCNIGGTGFVLFTNPISNLFVSGTYFDKNEYQITVKIDYADLIEDLKVSTKITEFSYFNSNECKTVSCSLKQILDINGEQLVIFEMDK